MAEKYRPCPYCGLDNIRERRICKNCRRDLVMVIEPANGFPCTENTGHLYYQAEQHITLFLVPLFLEYTAPNLVIRTTWINIVQLRRQRSNKTLQIFLALEHAATIYSAPNNRSSLNERLIPLTPFGYPDNPGLISDLQRYAPHLRLTY